MMRTGHGFALGVTGAAVALWAAVIVLVLTTAEPPNGPGRVIAVFLPGTSDVRAISSIIRSGARPIADGGTGFVWAVRIEPGGAERLRSEGAIAVLRDLPFASAFGCSGIAVSAE